MKKEILMLEVELERLWESVSYDFFDPEEEEWFFPNLSVIIKKYGEDLVIEYVRVRKPSLYYVELMVKAGLKNVDRKTLLEYTESKNEDDVFAVALCLSMCGHKEGFDLLHQFAEGTHPLLKNIHPVFDIIPELKFIEDPRAKELEKELRRKHNYFDS